MNRNISVHLYPNLCEDLSLELYPLGTPTKFPPSYPDWSYLVLNTPSQIPGRRFSQQLHPCPHLHWRPMQLPTEMYIQVSELLIGHPQHVMVDNELQMSFIMSPSRNKMVYHQTLLYLDHPPKNPRISSTQQEMNKPRVLITLAVRRPISQRKSKFNLWNSGWECLKIQRNQFCSQTGNQLQLCHILALRLQRIYLISLNSFCYLHNVREWNIAGCWEDK